MTNTGYITYILNSDTDSNNVHIAFFNGPIQESNLIRTAFTSTTTIKIEVPTGLTPNVLFIGENLAGLAATFESNLINSPNPGDTDDGGTIVLERFDKNYSMVAVIYIPTITNGYRQLPQEHYEITWTNVGATNYTLYLDDGNSITELYSGPNTLYNYYFQVNPNANGHQDYLICYYSYFDLYSIESHHYSF